MVKLPAIVLLLAAVCTGARSGEYHGADQGMLVVSMGIPSSNAQPFDTYLLNYKVAGQDAATFFDDPDFGYSPGAIFDGPQDFNGREIGRVQVHHLRPGKYEIYKCVFDFSRGMRRAALYSRREFSIPFTVKPGETTYIGDFTGVSDYGHGPVTGYFVLSDQHERDIAIARKKEPALFAVTIAVADPKTLGIPEFVAAPIP